VDTVDAGLLGHTDLVVGYNRGTLERHSFVVEGGRRDFDPALGRENGRHIAGRVEVLGHIHLRAVAAIADCNHNRLEEHHRVLVAEVWVYGH